MYDIYGILYDTFCIYDISNIIIIFTSIVLPHDPPTGKLGEVSSSGDDQRKALEIENWFGCEMNM